jgi:hypothetical protein
LTAHAARCYRAAMTSRIALAGLVAVAAPVVRAHAQTTVDSFVAALDQQAQGLQLGAARVGDVVRGVGQRLDWTVQLAPGNCYLVAARGGAGVRRISLTLFAPDGKRAAVDKPRGTTSSIRYCSTWVGSFHVQAKIEGQGAYLAGTYVLPSRPAPPLVGHPGATPPPLHAPPPYAPPPPDPIRRPLGAACTRDEQCRGGLTCQDRGDDHLVCM